MRLLSAIMVVLILLCPQIAKAVDPEGCMECHRLGLISSNAGEGASEIKIDSKKLALSPHGDTYCTDCHTDGGYVPHTLRPEEISCTERCHSKVDTEEERKKHTEKYYAYQKDPHFLSDIKCGGCHNSRTWGSRSGASSVCIGCHMDKSGGGMKILLSTPVHGKLIGDDAKVVCVDCHSPHVPVEEEGEAVKRDSNCYDGANCHGQRIFKKLFLGGHIESDSGSASLIRFAEMIFQAICSMIVLLGMVTIVKRRD